MDEWLGLPSTAKTQKKLSSSKNQKQKKKQQTLPQNQNRDLQLALEESRLASDIEKAIALSLLDTHEQSNSHHKQQQQQQQQISAPKTTPPRFTISSSSPYSSARRFGSKPSSASTSTTTHRLPLSNDKYNPVIPLSSSSSSDFPSSSSGTWAVDTFVNELLNPPSPEISDDEISLDTDFDYDDDTTIESDSQQSVENPVTTLSPSPTRAPRTAMTPAPRTTTETPTPIIDDNYDRNDDDNSDWEIAYDPDTETLPPPATDIHDGFHNEQAESDFFGQLRRETWDKDDLRATHDAMKKRSITTAVTKKNKSRRIGSSHASSTGENHDYYTTADDVLEGAFEAAGFGDSAAGLSWEGVGQSRYA